jgi:hypothetical protein
MLKGCDDRTTVSLGTWRSGSAPGSGLAVDEPDDVSFLTVCPRTSSCAYHVVHHKSNLS